MSIQEDILDPFGIDQLSEEMKRKEARERGIRDLDELNRARGLISLQAGEKVEPVQWLCKDFLTVGGSALLSAKPKAGKSSLTAALALAAASGTGAVRNLAGGWLLDFQAKPVPTFYLDTENPRSLALRRLTSLAKENGFELDPLLRSGALQVICLEGERPPFLNTDKPDLSRDLELAQEWGEKMGRKGAGYELMIIDVMSDSYPLDEYGRNENDPGMLSNHFRIINTLRKHSGACVLQLHHHKKGFGSDQEMASGHNQMLRKPETLCSLSDLPQEVNPGENLFCLRTVGRQIEKIGRVYLEAVSSQDRQCRIFRQVEEPRKEAKTPGRKSGDREAAALETLEAAVLKCPETFQGGRSFSRSEWVTAAERTGTVKRSKETLEGYLDSVLVPTGKVELIGLSPKRLYKLSKDS
jgi:hypothetical protein